MFDDKILDESGAEDRADRVDTRAEQWAILILRILALPFLVVAIVVWGAVVAAASLVRGLTSFRVSHPSTTPRTQRYEGIARLDLPAEAISR